MESQTETKQIPWETSLRYDAFVIGLFALVLIAGLGLKTWVEGEATIFTDPDANLSLSYPASWAPQTEKGTLLSIRDLQSKGTFKVTFSVAARELEPTAIKPIQELVEPLNEEKGQELTAYRILEISDTKVDKLEAARISYAYVDDPIGGSLQTSLPVVVQGVDILVIHGTNLYVFTFAAPAATFSQQTGTLEAILCSVSFNLED
jgi:hypothetical protein